jgi:ribose 5-phosphate isomerase B
MPMRIALGSDARAELTTVLERWLREHGYEVQLMGALAGEGDSWPRAAHAVARAVATANCAFGVVCCWTGTGVSIAANKVPGVRAALCGDPQTAAGAREWNDANVLCLSIRATSAALGEEILDAWFSAVPTADSRYRAMIAACEATFE